MNINISTDETSNDIRLIISQSVFSRRREYFQSQVDKVLELPGLIRFFAKTL